MPAGVVDSAWDAMNMPLNVAEQFSNAVGLSKAVESLPLKLQVASQVSKNEQRCRQGDLAQLQEKWAWKMYPVQELVPGQPPLALPPHIENVPPMTHGKQIWQYSQYETFIAGEIKAKFNNAAGLFDKKDGDPYEPWLKMYGGIDDPAVKDSPLGWDSDAEFGRQKMNGVLPNFIKRIKALPDNFPVTNAHLETATKGAHKDLQTLLGAGRVYLLDMEFNQRCGAVDTEEAKKRNMTAPMILFYLSDEEQLLPVAIQMGQDPKEHNYILTPNGDDESTGRWRVAKMLCNSAEGCLHEVANHLLSCHYVSEIIYVALNRTLHPRHPINQILMPHYWFTLVINDGARNTLTKDASSMVPKVMAMGYEGMVKLLVQGWADFDMGKYVLEDDLKKRDVNDLPGYHWRDDSRQVWHSIHKYVSEALDYFYTPIGMKKENEKFKAAQAELIKNDPELQAFFRECTHPSNGNLRGSPFDKTKEGKTMPEGGWAAESLEDLVLFVTEAIWAATGFHASYNNGQYDYFGFVPNAPGYMQWPKEGKDLEDGDQAFTIPRGADDVYIVDTDHSRITKALPDESMSQLQVSFISILSLSNDNNNPEMPDSLCSRFSHYPRHMCNNAHTKRIFDAWQKDLQKIGESIRGRNTQIVLDNEKGDKKKDMPYTYLDPLLPCAHSIAI